MAKSFFERQVDKTNDFNLNLIFIRKFFELSEVSNVEDEVLKNVFIVDKDGRRDYYYSNGVMAVNFWEKTNGQEVNDGIILKLEDFEDFNFFGKKTLTLIKKGENMVTKDGKKTFSLFNGRYHNIPSLFSEKEKNNTNQ